MSYTISQKLTRLTYMISGCFWPYTILQVTRLIWAYTIYVNMQYSCEFGGLTYMIIGWFLTLHDSAGYTIIMSLHDIC